MEENAELLPMLTANWREGLAGFIKSKIAYPRLPSELRVGVVARSADTSCSHTIPTDILRTSPSFLNHKVGGSFVGTLMPESRVMFAISGGDREPPSGTSLLLRNLLVGLIGSSRGGDWKSSLIKRPFYQMTVVYSNEPVAGCRPLIERHLGLKFAEDEAEAKIIQYNIDSTTGSSEWYAKAQLATPTDFESFHSLIGFVISRTKSSYTSI